MFKILVVDDDPNVNLFISRLLTRKFNCTVVSASNGVEAISKLKEEDPQFEIVFLDVTMPVMNGIETLEAIKSEPKWDDIPIIMLTAVSERQVIQKIMEFNVEDYILKPLVYDTAYNRFKEIFDEIRKKRLQDSPRRAPENDNREKLLVVEKDEVFRKKFAEQMSATYRVLQAENGADGLRLYMDEKPTVVYLGENLPLLNEKLFAQKIKALKDNKNVVIYTVRENVEMPPEERALFDHVIPKNPEG